MTSEVILICSPISHFVGEIAPDDAILIEWQKECVQLIVEMLDSLVGYNHAKYEEEDEGETSRTSQYPVLRKDGVGKYCDGSDETEMRHQVVEKHQGAHRHRSTQ